MPIGEIIGEVILRPIFELIFYGLSCWIGFLVLKSVSFGGIRLAPLDTLHEKNPSRKKWNQSDWSIWLYLPKNERVLKAECVCLVGMVVSIALGLGIHFLFNKPKESVGETVVPTISGNLQQITP